MGDWKARCVSTCCGWDKGDIIEVKDGIVINCSKDCWLKMEAMKYSFLKSFDNFKNWSSSEWEEIKEGENNMGGNFKVRALMKDESFFNKGDIIEFKNGYCRWSDGGDSARYDCFGDLIYENDWEGYLELIEEEGVSKVKDLRELIKPCYVVVRRDGSVCGVFEIKEGLKLQEKLDMGMCDLSDYDEQLYKRGKGFSETDIMEIYGFKMNGCFGISTYNRPLIWKREEAPIKSPTELEIESIEEEQRKLADRLAKLKESL